MASLKACCVTYIIFSCWIFSFLPTQTNIFMTVKKAFGIFFTLLGAFGVILGAIGLLSGGTALFGAQLSVIGSLVPLIIGLIFFAYGMKLMKGVKE